ncbi:MAG: glutamate--tRNA ligase [Desulfofustis sp.]|jgi:glutamyl-tRNA synthetase
MPHPRLRFPPSPTGYLHIGGARTALYNWLYVKKTGGTLVLRIEDTDTDRSSEESIAGIIDGLEWLGIDWDEGPYFQTDFSAEHRRAADKLLQEGKAYRCFCTREELEKKREAALAAKQNVGYDGTCRHLSEDQVEEKLQAGLDSVLRFKVPERPGKIGYHDEVLGRIESSYAEIDDFVIVRSNGSPLYLLCNVVDDIRDRISHVVRGQDHMTNTIKQLLLYEALGAPVPVFAHMPLTLDTKKAKISKRSHGEIVAVQFYRDNGFLPWAFNNFLVLLGWSPGDDREIFSREELIEAFSLDRINKSASIFNYRKGDPKFFTDPKAIAINEHYLRTMPVEELAPQVREVLIGRGLWHDDYDGGRHRWFLDTIELIRSRFHVLTDFATMGRAYFSDEYDIEEKPLNKNVLKHPGLKQWLPELADDYEKLSDFSVEHTEKLARVCAEQAGVKPGVIINGMRTVVTGQLAGPSMFDILVTIGQEKVVSRLRKTPQLYP